MSDLKWTPHPVLKVPTREQALRMGEGGLADFYQQREERIKDEVQDPFRFGYELEWWKVVDGWMAKLREEFPKGVLEELDLGGNRATKSERAAKRAMEVLVERPGARVWCCQSTQSLSQQTQQPLMWKYLPAEWRPSASGKFRKGVTTKIVYSQAGGFTEDTFVLPNGAQCWFKFYSQDVKSLEGPELDLAWCDELVTPEWLDALRYRLVTRSGRLHTTFTPVDGYNETVKAYLSGARTLVSSPAELLPVRGREGEDVFEEVPRVQRSPLRPNALIFYFHTKDNPYNDYESMRTTLLGKNRETIKTRAYGVPTKRFAGRFPKFNDRVHVIPADRVPVKGTRYLILDPCGGRNWFMTWLLVDVLGRHFVYREWPCPKIYIEGVGYPGPWAEPDGKKSDGKKGPAQDAFGFGMTRYKEEIERLERISELRRVPAGERLAREVIFERYMDSRYANSRTVGKEQATTLIEEMEEVGMTFLPTPGENIDEGVDMINTALDYDASRPVDALNEPRLYVVGDCENTIYALQEWTGTDGRHGACKDPVDNVRYAMMLGLDDVSGDVLKTRGCGAY